MSGDVLLIGSGSVGRMEAEAGPDVHIPWDTIRRQLAEIGQELGDLFDAYSGQMTPDSIAVELGVTAGGEVGIIISKASIQVGTSITLTFTRAKH